MPTSGRSGGEVSEHLQRVLRLNRLEAERLEQALEGFGVFLDVYGLSVSISISAVFVFLCVVLNQHLHMYKGV